MAIQIRRGNQADLQVGSLSQGEPFVCLDTKVAGIKGNESPIYLATGDSAGRTPIENIDGAVPATRTIAGLALSGNITLDQLIAAGLAPITGLCRPNLLTDGNIQVWQESESFSGLTGNRYTATMWQTWQSTGAAYDVQKAGDLGGIIITNRSSSAIEVSLVTLVEKGTVKPGSVYTVTLKGVRNGSAFTFYVADYGKAAFANKVLTESDSSFTFTTPASLENHFYVAVSIGNLAAGAQAEIDAVKLEEGDRFTGFYTEQYADVVAKTLRYYQRSFDGSSLTLNTVAGTADFFIPLHCPMRVIPAVTIIPDASTEECIGTNWAANVTPTNLRCLATYTGGFALAFDNATANNQYLLRTDVIQADARM